MTEPYIPLQRVLDFISLGGSVQKLEANIRNLPRVELNPDRTVPCSIPRELVDACDCVTHWYNAGGIGSTTGFGILYNALQKALQGQCDMHVSKQRQEELEQAEKLLEKVCQLYKDYNYKDKFTAVPGLSEWWNTRKPKSEREKKLEKIRAAVKKFTLGPHESPVVTEPIEEAILKALETN